MLAMPLRWARMAPTIAATCDSARPPGIGTAGIPSIWAGIFPAVMPMRSIVVQNCLNRSWDGFSSAMASSSPVGGPRAGANPQSERHFRPTPLAESATRSSLGGAVGAFLLVGAVAQRLRARTRAGGVVAQGEPQQRADRD